MRHDLWAIFAGALLLRLVFCFAVYSHLADSFGQGDGYDVIAQNLVEGRGYTLEGNPAAAVRLPLLPWFYAALLWLGGPSAWPWQAAQCLIGAATCSLVYVGARPLAPRRGAWAAAAFCALHPTMVLFTARPMTETLYVFLVLSFAVLLLRPAASGFAAGVALGAQLLMKSTALVGLVAFAPIVRRRPALIGNAALGALLVVSPWVAWNLATSGTPHLLSATGGLTLYHGLYISRHIGWFDPAADLNSAAEIALWHELERRGVAIGAPSEERDAVARQAAVEVIVADPVRTSALALRNLALTWYLGRSRTSMLVHLLAHATLLGAAAMGARNLWNTGPEGRDAAATLLLLIAAYTGVHALVHPAIRYVLPAAPLCAILAAAAFGRRDQG